MCGRGLQRLSASAVFVDLFNTIITFLCLGKKKKNTKEYQKYSFYLILSIQKGI